MLLSSRLCNGFITSSSLGMYLEKKHFISIVQLRSIDIDTCAKTGFFHSMAFETKSHENLSVRVAYIVNVKKLC